MEWQGLAGVIVFTVLSMAGFWVVPRLWRDADFCDALGAFFARTGGEAFGQGMARSGPMTWVAVVFFTASGWVMLFSDESSATPPAIALMILAGIAYALDWIIVFFNRPASSSHRTRETRRAPSTALRLPFRQRRNDQQQDRRGADVDLRSG